MQRVDPDPLWSRVFPWKHSGTSGYTVQLKRPPAGKWIVAAKGDWPLNTVEHLLRRPVIKVSMVIILLFLPLLSRQPL